MTNIIYQKNETPEEKARRLGVPIIPKLPMPKAEPNYDPNPIVSICGECGLELRRVMGYVCSNLRCPCRLGGAYW